MPNAAVNRYSPNDPTVWKTKPGTVKKALDELGGQQQRGLYDAYDATGAQAVNGSASTVNIDTQRTSSSSTMFVLSSDQLTVTLDGGGIADISYRFTLGNTGTDDFGFDGFLEQAPASTGTFAEVTGSRLSSGEADDDIAATGLAVDTYTSAQTLTAANQMVLVDASSGAVTITLTAAAALTGEQFDINKIDVSGNAVTVDAAGSELINGSLTAVINAQYESITVVSDGSGWVIK